MAAEVNRHAYLSPIDGLQTIYVALVTVPQVTLVFETAEKANVFANQIFQNILKCYKVGKGWNNLSNGENTDCVVNIYGMTKTFDPNTVPIDSVQELLRVLTQAAKFAHLVVDQHEVPIHGVIL